MDFRRSPFLRRNSFPCYFLDPINQNCKFLLQVKIFDLPNQCSITLRRTYLRNTYFFLFVRKYRISKTLIIENFIIIIILLWYWRYTWRCLNFAKYLFFSLDQTGYLGTVLALPGWMNAKRLPAYTFLNFDCNEYCQKELEINPFCKCQKLNYIHVK